MTTSTSTSGDLRLALDEIRVRENVRELDIEHVDALAQSIALRGLLVPLIVRAIDGAYELVAGYHRIAACRKLGLDDAPVVVREHEGSSADCAAENVTRKQLSPFEEARAVQAMLDEGYTMDGVAQALGWSRQLVSARAKILKLAPAGQQLVGTGETQSARLTRSWRSKPCQRRSLTRSSARSPRARCTAASSCATPPGRLAGHSATRQRTSSPRT